MSFLAQIFYLTKESLHYYLFYPAIQRISWFLWCLWSWCLYPVYCRTECYWKYPHELLQNQSSSSYLCWKLDSCLGIFSWLSSKFLFYWFALLFTLFSLFLQLSSHILQKKNAWSLIERIPQRCAAAPIALLKIANAWRYVVFFGV